MSLYGALYSGVSGLSAQSSAMGAISDNISNVNTTGYKGAKVNFNTLVTKQVSLTNYSPGGVQSKPRASIDVQGLLQATNSATDTAISGQGFFVVNEAANPGNGDMFAYTRAGSFKVDKEGYLQNVSGWYMQGWPLESWDNSLQASTVTIGNDTYMKGYKDDKGNQVYINDNIVSSTHLRPLNLNNIGGTASQTRNLRMGANLPNGDLIGATHKQPVTLYDSLGGDATVQFNWKKTAANNWDMEAIPPYGAKSMTLKNKNAAGNAGNVYSSMGRLDFQNLPTNATSSAMSMQINGINYSFATQTGTDGLGASQDITIGGVAAGTKLSMFLNGSATPTTITLNSATASTQATVDAINDQLSALGVSAGVVANGGTMSLFGGVPLTVNTAGSTGAFATAANWTSSSVGYQFYSSPSNTSLGSFVGGMAGDINTAFNFEYNSLYANVGAAIGAGNALNVTVAGATTNFNAAGQLDGLTASAAAAALNGNTAFSSLGLTAAANGNELRFYSTKAMTFGVSGTGDFAAANVMDGTTRTAAASKTTNGIQYCEQLAGTNSLIFRQYDATKAINVGNMSSLVAADGTPATMQAQDLNSPNAFTVAAAPDSSLSAIEFNGDGTPKTINVGFMDIDWANGSKDMTGADSIGLFLGNTGVRDGMSQLNGDYQLSYWSQNGAKFGNFSGVSIGADGIVTALFDNGVTRPVFQIPVSTFVNPNGMDSLTGNVFIATDNSGEPTLRSAGSAGAGSVQSASLEASTVDIGTEFTTMIVTQRAYSAAAKIITTADQMLDELVQIKR
ncbi:MAG: flagellar hook-basal body complex protein [Bacteroidota bacterium]